MRRLEELLGQVVTTERLESFRTHGKPAARCTRDEILRVMSVEHAGEGWLFHLVNHIRCKYQAQALPYVLNVLKSALETIMKKRKIISIDTYVRSSEAEMMEVQDKPSTSTMEEPVAPLTSTKEEPAAPLTRTKEPTERVKTPSFVFQVSSDEERVSNASSVEESVAKEPDWVIGDYHSDEDSDLSDAPSPPHHHSVPSSVQVPVSLNFCGSEPAPVPPPRSPSEKPTTERTTAKSPPLYLCDKCEELGKRLKYECFQVRHSMGVKNCCRHSSQTRKCPRCINA